MYNFVGKYINNNKMVTVYYDILEDKILILSRYHQ